MKKHVLSLGILLTGVSLFFSCKPTDKPKEKGFDYELEITKTALKNAPALQSFAHATDGDDWLLFAGRTNTVDPDKAELDDGGLHNMNADYTNQSFPPPSFNKEIFVYNPGNDAVAQSITVDQLVEIVSEKYPAYATLIAENKTVFQNTNSQVKQVGEFLYLVGGYGPVDIENPTKEYMTYNQIAQIHVPSLINIVKGDFDAVKEENLFAFGKHSNLIATGGELQAIGSGENLNLYLVGGHNFTTHSQKYQDAAYPFSLKDSSNILVVSTSYPISDVSDPAGPGADNNSTMRRRDGPILPLLFTSPSADATIEQGFAFFAGVFKPGDDPLEAWNDAVYFHPNFSNSEGKLFSLDTAYDQKNYNVYSCPNFGIYDEKSGTIHSFLMGGIGDGKPAPNGNLSGFTNTAMHIETNISDFTSKNTLISPENLFNKNKENVPNFYGAEAIFFKNDDIANFVLNKTETELLDLSKFGEGDVVVGHIFGGIEAFESNPASYGPRKSRASNTIFKVTLKKKK